jgi:hypothetical protein
VLVAATIRFLISKAGRVVLKLYDLREREIRKLGDGFYSDGSQEILLDASELASGIYFYAMEYQGFKAIRKMIVLE